MARAGSRTPFSRFTHILKRPGGYQWDVGLHYVGEMEEGSLGRKLFGFVTGGGVRWNPMPANYDRFLYPGIQFDVPKGEANFRRALTLRFPSEERRYPGFSEMVAFSELSTPLSVDHFTAHPHGAIYGVPATPERYRKSCLKPDTPVKGLYLMGTDAGTLGIMGAMMGGVSAASRIIGPFGLFSIVAAATRSQYKKVI